MEVLWPEDLLASRHGDRVSWSLQHCTLSGQVSKPLADCNLNPPEPEIIMSD
jgi:hypothetical protein